MKRPVSLVACILLGSVSLAACAEFNTEAIEPTEVVDGGVTLASLTCEEGEIPKVTAAGNWDCREDDTAPPGIAEPPECTDCKDGADGIDGTNGTDGHKGDKGDTGAPGAPGISGYVVTESDPGGSSDGSVDIECPPGLKVLGGGCRCGIGGASGSPRLINSTPNGETGWSCFYEAGTCQAGTVYARAICATVL